MDRYLKQIAFHKLGKEKQAKLLKSKLAIIGLGALGTVSANLLCRAGIGYLRIVDRDYVELSNLQRQIIYNENDALERLPKAIAAFQYLHKVNSEIDIDAHVTEVNSTNIEDLLNGIDLVLDATDNWEIRFLLNEACDKLKIPWIYGAAIGSEGITMNIIPGKENPCLKCLIPEVNSQLEQSCSTVGIMNMVTGIIASLQASEAIKLLIGSNSYRKELFTIDIWNNNSTYIKFEKKNDCPVCGKKNYEYLGKIPPSSVTSICGTNSYQIIPVKPLKISFSQIARRLEKIGVVKYNSYTLFFTDNKVEITLFTDGRAIINNAIDDYHAKSLFQEYLGY